MRRDVLRLLLPAALQLPFALFVVMFLLCLGRVASAATVSVVDGRYEGEKYLSVVGAIEAGDFLRVRSLIGTAIRSGSNPLTLILNSPGGDVDEAIKLGKLTRELMATTYIYGSAIYTPGTPDGDYLEGLAKKNSQMAFQLVPVRRGSKVADKDLVRCYSACVLLFYAGVDRYVSDNIDMRNGPKQHRSIPVVGLHRPYFSKGQYASLTPGEAKVGYAQLEKVVRNFLIEMGAPNSVADRMFRKASNEIDLVSDADFKSLYQGREPFLDEWFIAKCGAFGPASALNQIEYKEYMEYDSALREASKTGRFRSPNEFDAFVPKGMSSQLVQTLKAKITTYNSANLICRRDSLRKYQSDWLSRN